MSGTTAFGGMTRPETWGSKKPPLSRLSKVVDGHHICLFPPEQDPQRRTVNEKGDEGLICCQFIAPISSFETLVPLAFIRCSQSSAVVVGASLPLPGTARRSQLPTARNSPSALINDPMDPSSVEQCIWVSEVMKGIGLEQHSFMFLLNRRHRACIPQLYWSGTRAQHFEDASTSTSTQH